MQRITFVYLFFILATFTVFALWSLAGFALAGLRAFDETCTMMDLHAQGQKNEYVEEKLPCDKLAEAGNIVLEAQLGANAVVAKGNEGIQGSIPFEFMLRSVAAHSFPRLLRLL
jgi:hypothetical protein